MDPIRELQRIIDFEDPILFLGAGFSLGATTQNGRKFPTGKELKKYLITELLKYEETSTEYSDLIAFSLPEICDYCESEKSPAHLTDYLVREFQNAIPSNFHYLVSRFPWKKIYTTNIDDIIESCFSKENKELLVQNFKRKSTVDPKNKIEFIKLHGCVKNPSEGLTFSIKSYLDSVILNRDYRFSSLSLDMHSESIIFVGHDFNDFNIDYYLKLYDNSGYQTSRGKLIFINPYPSIIFKSKIKQSGGIVIEWNSQQFFEFVNDHYSKKNTSPAVNQFKSLTRFGFERLKEIKEKLLPIDKYESDLYFGFEPNWKDIYAEWDFQNIDIIEKLNLFLKNTIAKYSGIFSIYGKGLSGKSTYLLRIGAFLDSNGFEVWRFSGKYFNYFEFFKWIRLNDDKTQFALIFDDTSYYYKDISRLINLLSSSQRLIVITTARFPLHIRSRYNIVDNKHYEYYIEPRINDIFSENIAKKLEEKGYLGSLKKIDSTLERSKYISEKNDLVNILYEITFGKGFIKKLSENLTPLLSKDIISRDVLIALCIFEKLDLPFLPKELISLLYGSESKKILETIEDYIKYNSKNDISLRTFFYSPSIFRSASKAKLISVIKNILQSLAPQLDDVHHNVWTQIESSLTKEKLLRKRLGLKTTDIKDMLYELKLDLSTSYNYWIQLGIAEQMDAEYDKALNHFKQAEVINPGSYMVKNAIGRNFLKQANSINDIKLSSLLFSEGEKILLSLINNREEHQVRAFSTHTLLYEKINYLKKFNIIPSNEELREMFLLLKKLIEKDPEDIMAKQLSNVFFDFIRTIKKTNVINLNYYDISILKAMLSEYQIDLDDLNLD